MYYPRTILNNYNAAVPEENIFKHFLWILYDGRGTQIFNATFFLLEAPPKPPAGAGAGARPPAGPEVNVIVFCGGPAKPGAWAWAWPGYCDVTLLIPQLQVRTWLWLWLWLWIYRGAPSASSSSLSPSLSGNIIEEQMWSSRTNSSGLLRARLIILISRSWN